MTIAPERITQRSTNWLERAACRPRMTDDQIADRCPTCPVRQECLQDAIDTGDTETYRAGMTGVARSAWARAQAMSVKALPTTAVRPRAHAGPVVIDLDQVAAYRREHLSWREIGHRIGVNPETIRHRWVTSGRPHTGRAPNSQRDLRHDIDISDIARRVKAGHSTRRIARDLRIDWNTADRHVKRAREAGRL